MNDSATVAQANALDAVNGTGEITATISNGLVADLVGLSGTHAYTITVTDTAPVLRTENAEMSMIIKSDAANVLPVLTIGTGAGFGSQVLHLFS